MKIKFYDIKTKEVVYVEWEKLKKGVPIGYILYNLIEQHTRLYSTIGEPLLTDFYNY